MMIFCSNEKAVQIISSYDWLGLGRVISINSLRPNDIIRPQFWVNIGSRNFTKLFLPGV